MISTRTVFVLGAGASAPFAFPTGRQLVDAVINTLQNERHRKRFVDEFGFPIDQVVAFCDTLRRSARSSVDAFLEHREEFIDVGKAAIAYLLIQRETEEHLFAGTDTNWLFYLFDRMNCPFDDFGKNQVAFITFNYDRVVEHFLFTALQNSYGKTEQECTRQTTSIHVVHLHGSLGLMPWQLRQGEKGRAFEPVVNAASVNLAKQGIKIIHENLDASRDADFKFAKELLAKAARIYFLGFGFGEINCERLALHTRTEKQHIRATGCGLTDYERARIHARLNSHIKITPHDCIGLLRNVADW